MGMGLKTNIKTLLLCVFALFFTESHCSYARAPSSISFSNSSPRRMKGTTTAVAAAGLSPPVLTARFALLSRNLMRNILKLRSPKQLMRVTSGGLVTAAVTPGMRRTLFFWAKAFPIYLDYRLTQFRLIGVPQEIADPQWEKLHAKYAPEILSIITQLRGLYIKVGQVASTRPDFIPTNFVERLSTLQDNVPAKDAKIIKRILEKSLDCDIEETFLSFDETPLAAASIGQVHKAKLKNGHEVVVKVMYPEARRLFRSDLATMRSFFRLAQPEYVALLDEIERQFLTEFDYREEAKHLNQVGENMKRFSNQIAIPKPVMELTTQKVLVMEYLPGSKVLVGFKNKYSSLFKEPSKGVKSPIMTATDLGLLANILSRMGTAAKAKRHTHHVMKTLLKVHGHQVLKDGVFNGDPHPGNILLLSDGRLGLVDYGQVKVLTNEERKTLAKLIIALADEDETKVVEQFVSMGFKSKYMNDDVIKDVANLYFNRDDKDFTGGINPQTFLEGLQKRDPIQAMPEHYILAARASTLLRGLGQLFGMSVQVAKVWKPIAIEVLNEQEPVSI